MKRIGPKVIAVLLALTMVFSPNAMAMIGARVNGQPLNDYTKISDHLARGSLPIGSVRRVDPVSIEIIENTRELAIVRVGDILITQEISDKYSTEDTTVAVLRKKDLITNTVIEEMRISVRYEAGQYITTIFSGGVKIGPFSVAYDPLKPGALRNLEHRNIHNNIEDASQMQIQSQQDYMWWDGIKYICGTNINIKYSRPCTVQHPRCRYECVIIRGTRMDHIQIGREESAFLVGLTAGLAGMTIRDKLIKWGVGTIKAGGAAVLTAALVLYGLAETLIDDQGNIWLIVHRCWFLFIPRLFRAGRITLWDICGYTRSNPEVPGAPPCPLYLRIASSRDTERLVEVAKLRFKAPWVGTQVEIVPRTTGAGIEALQGDEIDIAMTSHRPDIHNPDERGPHALDVWKIAYDALAIIVKDSPEMGFLTSITRAQLYYIWMSGAGIVDLTWREVGLLEGIAHWPDAPVVPVAREIRSCTRDVFHCVVENGGVADEICPAREVATITAAANWHGHGCNWMPGTGRGCGNPGIVEVVGATYFSIGYVSRRFIHEPGIRAVKVEHVFPTREAVWDGTYPMYHSLYLVTLGLSPLGGGLQTDPTPNARAFDFINYILSPEGQGFVYLAGFVPLEPPVVPEDP